MACNDFRRVDNLQLQALVLKTALDLYEASLVEARHSFLTPPRSNRRHYPRNHASGLAKQRVRPASSPVPSEHPRIF
jgi:hypothetical protein